MCVFVLSCQYCWEKGLDISLRREYGAWISSDPRADCAHSRQMRTKAKPSAKPLQACQWKVFVNIYKNSIKGKTNTREGDAGGISHLFGV